VTTETFFVPFVYIKSEGTGETIVKLLVLTSLGSISFDISLLGCHLHVVIDSVNKIELGGLCANADK